jgi:hypothetical protein
MNDHRTHDRTMRPGQPQPAQEPIGRPLLETPSGPQAIALIQKRQTLQDDRTRTANRLPKRAPVGTESAPASCTVITTLRVTEDFDVARGHLAKISALDIVAPLTLKFHDVAPPVASDDTSKDASRLTYTLTEFHGLPIQHPTSEVVHNQIKAYVRKNTAIEQYNYSYPLGAFPKGAEAIRIMDRARELGHQMLYPTTLDPIRNHGPSCQGSTHR